MVPYPVFDVQASFVPERMVTRSVVLKNIRPHLALRPAPQNLVSMER